MNQNSVVQEECHIKADDPGSVWFKQKRVAQNKGYFQLLKFHFMSVNTLNLLFPKGIKQRYVPADGAMRGGKEMAVS